MGVLKIKGTVNSNKGRRTEYNENKSEDGQR